MSSAWTVEYQPGAQKQLKKIDRAAALRIVRTLQSDLERHGDPRAFGEAMVGGWTGFWRYRVGDYRAICRIEDARITVVVIEVAHRREVYR
ncbi:MAG TPA: type II toxin-antitoxin system RelE/ParE family toxin [Sphingomonas sp.]|uniref:type II toxin-antitoxin system RelE family toxin n=1 Tax=Sphingomonas sp. TaxID=28214 RepID=UPI002ED893DA